MRYQSVKALEEYLAISELVELVALTQKSPLRVLWLCSLESRSGESPSGSDSSPFRFSAFGFRFPAFGLRLSAFGFAVSGFRLSVFGFPFSVFGFLFSVFLGLGFVSVFGFWALGFRFSA